MATGFCVTCTPYLLQFILNSKLILSCIKCASFICQVAVSNFVDCSFDFCGFRSVMGQIRKQDIWMHEANFSIFLISMPSKLIHASENLAKLQGIHENNFYMNLVTFWYRLSQNLDQGRTEPSWYPSKWFPDNTWDLRSFSLQVLELSYGESSVLDHFLLVEIVAVHSEHLRHLGSSQQQVCQYIFENHTDEVQKRTRFLTIIVVNLWCWP